MGCYTMKKDSYHITPHTDGWAVARENTMRAQKVFSTKASAKRFAREEARKNDGYVVVHRKNGTIQGVIQPQQSVEKSDQHVVPRDERWAIIKANAERPTIILSSKMEAIRRAKEFARNQGTRVVVHDSEGLIKYNQEPTMMLGVLYG